MPHDRPPSRPAAPKALRPQKDLGLFWGCGAPQNGVFFCFLFFSPVFVVSGLAFGFGASKVLVVLLVYFGPPQNGATVLLLGVLLQKTRSVQMVVVPLASRFINFPIKTTKQKGTLNQRTHPFRFGGGSLDYMFKGKLKGNTILGCSTKLVSCWQPRW